MKKLLIASILAIFLISLNSIVINVEAFPAASPDFSSASEVIDLVNILRGERGLPAYTPNAILMSIAQTQAEYVASIGVSTTHIDAYGRRPFQRALDAGYAVAGDLSLGGFFSENVIGNVGLTPEGAVDWWMGDAEHQGTMLSPNLEDVGVGVAVVLNTYYYVLDAGLSTSGTPRAYTPPPYIILNTPTIATNTPDAEGAIFYVVQPGDTLLKIAIAYNISLADLYALNGLNERSIIYPDQKIIIQAAFTPTPTSLTPTSTERPTSTRWPTSSSTQQKSDLPPPTTSSAEQPSTSAGGVVIVIVIAALITAAFLTMAGSRKRAEKK